MNSLRHQLLSCLLAGNTNRTRILLCIPLFLGACVLTVPAARALEACSVLPLVEVSAALDPATVLTVQGGGPTNPHAGNCMFQSADGSSLGVNASDDPIACAKTLGIIERQTPRATSVSGIGDRALLRSESGILQLITVQSSRCIALTLNRKSHLADLDSQHVLTVLTVEALKRSWTDPPRNYWDEPATLAHLLTDERILSYDALLKLGPQDLNLLLALGNLYFRANQFESARQYLLRAVEVAPKRADLYYDLGTIDWQPVKRFLSAHPTLKAQPSQSLPFCVTPDPSVSGAANQAIKHMELAFAIDPGCFPAASYLATMYRGRADLQCQNQLARESDLKKGEQWQATWLDGAQHETFQSPHTANAAIWKDIVPFGTPPPPPTGAANANGSSSGKVLLSPEVSQGLVITQVPPIYPALARQARIQGTVVVKAIIAIDGSVQDVQLVSGHPMLAPAALEAVKQWKFKPYFLNGAPAEVETTINVSFALTGVPPPRKEQSAALFPAAPRLVLKVRTLSGSPFRTRFRKDCWSGKYLRCILPWLDQPAFRERLS